MSKSLWRPRRSCLYTPASNARALEKAPSLAADVVIIDLEDAVAPAVKAVARAAALRALNTRAFGDRETFVRINSLEQGRDDLAALASVKDTGILAPKIHTVDDVAQLDEAMSNAGFGSDAALWVMIETPRAVLELVAIAAAAEQTRLCGLVLGLNDLGDLTGMRAGDARAAFHAVLTSTVLAARAYGLSAIDGVYNDIRDAQGFAAECAQARAFGFDGKSVIHPTQIDQANTMFSPSPEEVVFARAVIKAFEAPENQDKGALKVEGRMVERLHYEDSRELVRRADLLAALEEAYAAT